MATTADRRRRSATSARRSGSAARWAVRVLVFGALTLGALVAMAEEVDAQQTPEGVVTDGATSDPATSEPEAPVPAVTDLDFGDLLQIEGVNASDPLVVVPQVPDVPDVGISINSENGGLSQTVMIVLLLTVGSVAPSLLLLTTSFTRFAIVLALTRNAIGTQQVPPTQVLTGLALFLTLFVMAPVLSQVNEDALQPLLNGEMGQAEAFEAGFAPLREFMSAQTSDDDLRLFLELRGEEEPTTVEEVGPSVMIPAFVLSELRTAFTIGFVIFVPFLVVDLVVSSVLMSMGMVMLPPVFISLPLKLLMFVLVDGWSLIVESLVTSVNTT